MRVRRRHLAAGLALVLALATLAGLSLAACPTHDPLVGPAVDGAPSAPRTRVTRHPPTPPPEPDPEPVSDPIQAAAFGPLVPCPGLGRRGEEALRFVLPEALQGEYPSTYMWTVQEGFYSPLPSGRALVMDQSGLLGTVAWEPGGCVIDWDDKRRLSGRVDRSLLDYDVSVVACGFPADVNDDGTFSLQVPRSPACEVAVRLDLLGGTASASVVVDTRDDVTGLQLPIPDLEQRVPPHQSREECLDGRGFRAALNRLNAGLAATGSAAVPPLPLWDCDHPDVATPEEEAERLSALVEPSTGVVGLALHGAVVTVVLPGSPADGWVQVGDVVLAVDGVEVDDVRAAVAGPSGEAVVLTLDRAGTLVELTLVRAPRE